MSAKAIAAWLHWIRKMQARYLAEDYQYARMLSSFQLRLQFRYFAQEDF
jgi:hypothetical protein